MGMGMVVLIGFKIGFAIHENQQQHYELWTPNFQVGELEKCRCTIHLNPKAVPDLSQIERVK